MTWLRQSRRRVPNTRWAPWHQLPADDKRRARLNCIAHLLSVVPYEEQDFEAPEFDERLQRPDACPEDLKFRHEVSQVY